MINATAHSAGGKRDVIGRTARRGRLPAVLAALCLGAALAPAQPAAAPADDTSADRAPLAETPTGGHGWALQRREIVVRPGPTGEVDRTQGASLVHLPPRTGSGAADFGAVRTVMTFPTAPVRAVGYGPDVYLIFAPASPSAPLAAAGGGEGGAAEPGKRRVLGIHVVPVTVGGTVSGWRDEPPGRAESLPSMTGSGTLVGASAASVGPVALLREGDHAAGESTWRVLVLWQNAWRSFEAPWASATATAAGAQGGRSNEAGGEGGWGGPGLKGVIAGGDRALAIAWMESPLELVVWEGRLSRSAAAAEQLEIDWRRRTVALEPPAGAGADIEAADLAWIDGTLILLGRAGSGGDAPAAEAAGGAGLLVFDVTRERGIPIARLPAAAQDGGAERWTPRLIPMQGAERFALLAAPQSAGEGAEGVAAGADSGVDRILEMSTTGRLWYEGPVARRGPLSLRDLRALAFMLGALAVLVIVFVFRPEATPIVTLPKGAALAPTWRRSVAAAVDLLIALVLASLVMGDGPFGLLRALLSGSGGAAAGAGAAAAGEHLFTGLLLAQGMGILHCALAETFGGRSIGKRLLGLLVLSPRSRPGRLEPRAAILRNVVKWGLPMLLIFAMWDPMRRHPGDLLAGTLVVEPEGEEEGE